MNLWWFNRTVTEEVTDMGGMATEAEEEVAMSRDGSDTM
jgi:hypothetical protein